MEPRVDNLRAETRRWFLEQCGVGLGGIALASLLGSSASGEEKLQSNAQAQRGPHFRPRAKRVLYIHMAGAPSHLDLFDDKPKLRELNGQPVSESVIKGERFAFIKGTPKVLGSPYKFARHGASGLELSELLPKLATIADDIAVVRSMTTTEFNHAPAQIFLNTGHPRIGRPSMGSWLSYGLGSENSDLPAYVVLLSGPYAPDGGASLWGSGFLPGEHQGVRFRSAGDPVLFLSDPPGVSRDARRRELDALSSLNSQRAAISNDPEIQTRISQYELAWRMQSSVPELLEIASEPDSIKQMYGIEPGKVSFANNALLARRLLERGVRFVELYHWGWDSHGTGEGDDIVHSLPKRCLETDAACTALVTDLKQRGLLEDTLIVWGGEFGRTPMNEERDGSKFFGRDHHPHCFSIWLAGGGIKGGTSLGATDELGYHVVEDKVEVNDLHATMLHLLGIDHERLTFRFQGRDYRLTDVAGKVVNKLLA
jgi:hypothetical protein